MRMNCVVGVLAGVVLSAAAQAQMITSRGGFTMPAPPALEKRPVTDTYQVVGGSEVTVTDNYQYLEDAHSPETRAFINTQNAYTQAYLDKLGMLPEVQKSMALLLKVDQMSIPTRRGEKLFFSRRKADENQGSIYMRVGLHGEDVKLIDGPSRSADGNTSVNMMGLTEHGSVLIYEVRVGGADGGEVHFFDVVGRKDMGDVLPSARYYGAVMAPDKKGVYYSRFTPHIGCKVYYHAWGTPVGPESDKLLLGGEYKGEALGEIDGISLQLTENEHWLVFSINRGVPPKRTDLLVKDLRVADTPIVPLVYGVEARFREQTVGTIFISTRTGTRRTTGC